MADQKPGTDTVPLFVDVDGTLTRADISLESFVTIARLGVKHFFMVLIWLMGGRALAKSLAARQAPINPALLPYRPEVLALIDQAKADGRPVILASASHVRNIKRIARHLGLSDDVIATRGRSNAKGQGKLAMIRDRIGAGQLFDYVGDSSADQSIWARARTAYTVGVTPNCPQGHRLANKSSFARSFVKAMRPHQWAKNALVFVPAITSGLITHGDIFFKAACAAVAMSLVASSIYLINDLLDIESDRAHRSKWKRPIAHGDVSIPAAVLGALVLAALGLGMAWVTGGAVPTLWLLVYMAITTAYSFRLKSVMVGDAIVLASLYTIRIWIGGVAIGVTVSFWLFLFSVFFFLSLAYLKRYIEMRDSVDADRLVRGRGYVGGDLDVVMSAGMSAGMVSILVLALFSHDPQTRARYAEPDLLWLICLPILYWLNRIWMMARRGEVDGDPVAFAIKDYRSILVGFVIMVIFLAAFYGWGW